jgi:hypothetical protein
MANSESAKAMRAAAIDFLEAAPAPASRRPFVDEDERRNWHYVPRRREGLRLADMDAGQERAAFGLLATGLSIAGHAAASAVVALEDVLDRMEGGARRRHRRDYSVTVFGDPITDAAAPWGWRFEGHHVSVNATIVGGDVALSPLFLGANPAEVVGPTGHPITRPLAAEEDVALGLVDALTPAQRDDAFVSDAAPDDILTEAAPRLDEGNLPDRAGVRVAALAGEARQLAEALVRLYLDRLPADVAGAWWSRLEPELGDLHLAFAGEPAHRRPHYYRLLAPSLLVEYDNTQDDANHVHTVVRDPAGDFGDDLLRAHRRGHH